MLLKMDWLKQSISLVGAAFGLFAYIMLQLEKRGWGAKDRNYLLFCTVGGTFLSIASIWDKNIGFTLLNTVFTAFSIAGLIKRYYVRTRIDN